MFRKNLVLFLVLGVILSCSKKEKKLEIAKPTFVILEASRPTEPLWVNDIRVTKDMKDIQDYKYFISDSSHSNKRLCEKGASARASAAVATQVSQFIKESYNESIQGVEAEDISNYTENTLAQEVQSFLTGVEVEDTFWVKRGYRVKMKAKQDKDEYHCYALVKVKRSLLDELIRKSTKRLFDRQINPEVKQKAQQATEEAVRKFNEIG